MLDETESAVFDMNLMNMPELAEASSAAVWNERMAIGVRNDHGNVYRLIGISSLSDLRYLLGKMRKSCLGKYKAEEDAKRVAGVVGLANGIEMRLPAPDQSPDPDIG